AAGLAMWLWVGKPASFYSENPVFLVKLGLVISLGLLSIYPTVFFTRNKSKREGDSQDIVHIPNGVIWSVRIELLLLFSIPLLAILMARGISSF
ncbi:MAG: DUF2214 family protein, partial [Cyclobacteriaceae bacterium]|nr:DUF2214 family protein [Cyclobacteriaceae bacterium HetDA_MAG_MS6]